MKLSRLRSTAGKLLLGVAMVAGWATCEAAAQAPVALFEATHYFRGRDLYRTTGAGASIAMELSREASSSTSVELITLGSIQLVAVKNQGGQTRVGLYRVAASGDPTPVADASMRSLTGIRPIRVIDGKLIFLAALSTGSFFYETDGTNEGTRRIISDQLNFNDYRSLIDLDGRLLLITNQYVGGNTYGKVWNLNLASGRLELAFDFPEPGVFYGLSEEAATVLEDADVALIWRQHPRFGVEPFVTDGTPEGTRLLKNIGPRDANGDYGSYDFVSLGAKALFTAYTDREGGELWVTDGTPDGTQLLADIFKGPESSEVRLDSIVVRKGRAYFQASQSGLDRSLWVTDGTTAGTRKVDLTHEGQAVNAESNAPGALMLNGKKLFFEGTKRSGDCPTSDDRQCVFDVALYSYNFGTKVVRQEAQTTKFACFFVNGAGANILIRGGSYGGLTKFGPDLLFAATGEKVQRPTPRCFDSAKPQDRNIEPFILRTSTGAASQIAEINPGPDPSKPEFLQSQ